MDSKLATKKLRLLEVLSQMSSVAVAFSGGVDSALVCWAAQTALGDKARAVTADSPSVPRAEIAEAIEIARQIGIAHEIISTQEFQNSAYLKNDGARCYFCKSELYAAIAAQLSEWQAEVICSGANSDDLGDYRPGLIAAAEKKVRHPLVEAGFSKAEVRDLAKEVGLSIWDKPASPCLSSRLAPGVVVTTQRTSMIEAAEKILRELGLRECRVRLHEGELARIEVPLEAIAKLMEQKVRENLARALRELGFRYITLDLEGFRSGNLNQLVDLKIRNDYSTVTNLQTGGKT
ncbi:ATP-dependent sacrificial sulfur transferase LarE [Telmatocola sphagniphila]|uniref:ATP-dependent sacrificial sulfur transferase LarE n=1 Tax=Telmatocola sphagniphila TaxID=1123043 RepID=A0A8E6BAM9_9BACT|nr:ATP-dependent sacrificial sulfur transferase LarE [Telmatocola sphagniphila]QVL33648.1 ATP-dependent sacrificial sulfur transferase LarE [Telmatocola sphagniphila]